jgi:Transglutaminase-like superfamily
MVRRAVLRAARLSPFRSDCLPQALVAATLCRIMRVPASVHLGVKLDTITERGPRAISAHAWVCSGREAVTGGRSFGAYTPVTCFLT